MFRRWEYSYHINVVKRTVGWAMIILSPLTIVASIAVWAALLLIVLIIEVVDHVNTHISS